MSFVPLPGMKKIPVRHISAPQPAMPDTDRFSIRNLQEVLGGKDLLHDHHKHDYYFVLVIQKGSGTHEIDFVPNAVQDHTVFILRPGQVHRLSLKAGSTGFLLEFGMGFYHPGNRVSAQQWEKATAKNRCVVTAERFGHLYDVLATIHSEYTHRQQGYREAIKACLELFFIAYNRQSLQPGRTARAESHYARERFEEFCRLLEKNIAAMKTVSGYAGLMNLSVYQLNAITKAAVGKTVSELINEQLILEAKRYLLATPNQVKDIAGLLGYEDFSYFIRFFKKQTGQSPEQFRKNFK